MSEFQYAGGITLSQVKRAWRTAIDAAGLDVPRGMAMVRPPTKGITELWSVAVVIGGRHWCQAVQQPVDPHMIEAAQRAKQWADQGD